MIEMKKNVSDLIELSWMLFWLAFSFTNKVVGGLYKPKFNILKHNSRL